MLSGNSGREGCADHLCPLLSRDGTAAEKTGGSMMERGLVTAGQPIRKPVLIRSL